MAVVKKVVEHHKGSIAVKSLVGEGTTFIMHIPLQTQLIHSEISYQ